MHEASKKLVYVLTISIFMSCASNHVDTWGDAALVAEQRATIEQQERTITDMGEVVRTVRDELGYARADIERSLAQNNDLRKIWGDIKLFVEAVLRAEQSLEGIQSTDRPEDAGER